MIRRVYHTTNDREATADIVQEAWIIILRKIRTLKDPRAFEWWSLRIATAKAIDWIRATQLNRKRSENRKEAQEAFLETSPVDSEEQISALRKAIGELPEDQQLVVRMFYKESLGVNEIGRILDIPSGTVKSRLFKARERLKKLLKDKMLES